MKNETVAVVFGGPSSESEISKRSAMNVFNALCDLNINAVMVEYSDKLISVLHNKKIDKVFLMMHGNPGEDGSVQGLLELARIPYTYSGVLSSALCLNKKKAKEIMSYYKLPVLNDKLFKDKKVLNSDISFPAVLKPNSEGSSIGVTIVNNIKDFKIKISDMLKLYGEILVEPYCKGREFTIGVLEEKQKIRALPIIELIPKNKFYDYEAKYTDGKTDFVVPAKLPEKIRVKMQKAACDAFMCLGCRSAARVDFVMDKNNRFYILEVNTIPGMTKTSDLPKAAESDGISFKILVKKILDTASLKGFGRKL